MPELAPVPDSFRAAGIGIEGSAGGLTRAQIEAGATQVLGTTGDAVLTASQVTQIQSLVSGAGKRTVGLHRFWGLRSGVSANSALLATRLLKFNVDAAFNEVRIHLMHYGASTTTWKAAIAATETADTSTQANIAQPVVGGSAYNVIDSTTDAYGWRTALWAGAATKTFAGTGSISGTDSVAETITSDWTQCQAVPRADGGSGYLLMVQAYPPNADTQAATWINASGIAAARTPTAANRGRILQCSRNTGDNIAAPGTITLSLVEDTIAIMVEVRYRAPAATVLQIGDSNFQNDALVADKVSCALARACADVSTAARPVVCCNAAGSSMASLGFWREAQKVWGLHKPSVAIYEAFTPNDNPYTNAGVLRAKLQTQEARIAEFLAYCRDNAIVPILDTGIPYLAGLDGTTDPIRKAYVATIRTMAAATGTILIDSDAFFSDGASPANIKSPYNNGDNIHYNEAGIEAKATQLIVPALRQALALS